MHQIVRGTTENAEFEIYVRGELANADGDVLVSVTDANYGTPVGTGGVAFNDPAIGKYTFDLDPEYTNLNRVLRLQWDYTVNGKAISSEDFYEVFTPYAYASDIIDYYNFGTRPQDLNYKSHDEIVYAERLARYQIESYTSQTFGRAWGDQEQFGYGSNQMELLQRMISVEKLYEDGVLIIDYTQDPVYNTFGSDIELSTTNKALRIVRDSYNPEYDGQMDVTTLYGGRFREHSRYKVYGEIGWTYVPNDVKFCAIRLVGNLLSRDAEWRERYLKKVNLSEISF